MVLNRTLTFLIKNNFPFGSLPIEGKLTIDILTPFTVLVVGLSTKYSAKAAAFSGFNSSRFCGPLACKSPHFSRTVGDRRAVGRAMIRL